MKTIYILVSLPGSGKSTWAKHRLHAVRDNKRRSIIINKDHIRKMIHGCYVFDVRDEPIVKAIAYNILRLAMCSSLVDEIIIDETNITIEKRKNLLAEIVSNINYITDVLRINDTWRVKYVWFTEAKRNLSIRMESPKGQSEATWKKVIDDMKAAFEPPTIKETAKEQGYFLAPKAVIKVKI